MPDMAQNTEQFRCTITHMFKGCPKDNGWFGCFAKSPQKGDDIKLMGTTTINLANGMQLDVTATPSKKEVNAWEVSEIRVITKTTRGTVAYLSAIRGISKATAQLIVNAYGKDAINAIKTDPDDVQQTTGLSDKQMKAIIQGISNEDITNVLQQQFPELSINLIKRIIKNYQNKCRDVDKIEEDLKDNPYAFTDIPGITFPIADAIALKIGIDPLSEFRVNHGLVHILKNNTSGHLFLNLSDNNQLIYLQNTVENALKIRFKDVNDFSYRLIRLSQIENSPIVIESFNNQAHLYIKDLYNAMMTAVLVTQNHLNMPLNTAINTKRFVASYMIPAKNNPAIGYPLNDEQKNAVITSVANPISIVTGGPGRGKTSVIDAIASCWLEDRKHYVLLLAPTGKAMNKLKIETKSKYQTMTIDRLIVSMEKTNRTTIGVENSDNTLVIIDESSMIDVEKIASLFSCIGACRYCFVGDIDQLPPISPGAFLSELIKSGKVPVSRLVQPLRNSGLILANADKINANDDNLSYDLHQMPFFPQKGDDENALQFIIQQYLDEYDRCPDITQLALLTPMRKGIIGVANININLQEIMCPENELVQPTFIQNRGVMMYTTKGYPIKSTIYGNGTNFTKFRIGDIVMNTKNLTQKTLTKYNHDDYWNGDIVQFQAGIFNGDCGKIIAYKDILHNPGQGDEELLIIQLFNGLICEISITAGEFDSFELAYAMTVHKSQGCEYKTVIYVSPNQLLNSIQYGFGNRNLVYTAITRAKERVVIIGSKESLSACIKTSIPPKNSTIAMRI